MIIWHFQTASEMLSTFPPTLPPYDRRFYSIILSSDREDSNHNCGLISFRPRLWVPDHQPCPVHAVQPDLRKIQIYSIGLLKAALHIRLISGRRRLSECRNAMIISDLATPSQQCGARSTTLILGLGCEIRQVYRWISILILLAQ